MTYASGFREKEGTEVGCTRDCFYYMFRYLSIVSALVAGIDIDRTSGAFETKWPASFGS